MATATEINASTAAWLRGLPVRWALGGAVLGIVWSLASIFQDSFANSQGNFALGLLRVFELVVLPLAILGLIWGYTAKWSLERSAKKIRISFIRQFNEMFRAK
jgi:hypothetical protein